MILQALCDYYNILADEGKVPPNGYSNERISYALLISRDGDLKNIVYLKKTDKQGKKFFPQLMTLPFQKKRSSGVFSYFLSDNSKYVLGLSQEKKKPVEISEKHFEAFKNYNIGILQNIDNDEAKAVINFLNKWDINQAEEKLKTISGYEEDIFYNSNFVFMLEGQTSCYIHDNSEINEKWLCKYQKDLNGKQGQCLITGEISTLALLHENLSGVKDAQSTGSAIVSFNKDSFLSYEKEQSYNAPVGVDSAFKYVTVLNYMLQTDSVQRIQIGDATTVFWAECPKSEECISLFNVFLNPPAKSEDKKSDEEKERDAKAESQLEYALSAIQQGNKISDLEDKNFYVLGLSPNNARIAIRFFYRDTLGGFVKKICQHYEDLELEGGRLPYLPPWLILNETTIKNSTKDKPAPLLSGRFMKSILTGSMYPEDLYMAIIRRIRAEQDINHARVSMIKAYLLRNRPKLKEVIKVSLNEETTNIAYRLGRLFAVLERIQRAALGDVNSTIKDRFFSSASSSPKTVFPNLINLAQDHLSKIGKSKKGLEIYFQKLIGEIIQEIEVDPENSKSGFPSHLTLEEQGLFILGYYQQRFSKKSDNDENEVEKEAPQELAEVQS